jgi:uncharacterized membrane-anchored protein
VSTNVLRLQPQPGTVAPDSREPLADAVLEASGYIRDLNGKHRRAHSRVLELKSGDPTVRRSRTRELSVEPQRPVTFFSIE